MVHDSVCVQYDVRRLCIVQAQYVFIHDALSELVQCGETEVLAANVRISINQLKRNVTDDPNTTGFQKQFQVCSGHEIEHVSYSD